MALSLGKLTLLVGAGILGSVLAKEGRLPSLSDVVSGALKVALKPTGQNDSASSTTKPRNDALMAQDGGGNYGHKVLRKFFKNGAYEIGKVNNLRHELQRLSSNRPVTIVTSNATGGRRYGVIIVIVVIGYGYVWWKGWKFPDFMFASKRGLSDACNSVAKQLEQVYSSITTTRKDLSSKLDESSRKYDDIATCSAATRVEAAEVRGEVSKFTINLRSMNHKIRTLETKWDRIQHKQDKAKEQVGKLLVCARDAMEDSPSSSSTPALERPRITVSSRTGSLPPALSADCPSSSSSNGSSEGTRHLRHAISDAGLKECQGISAAVDNNASYTVSSGTPASESSEMPPGSELPQKMPSRSPRLLSRTISAVQYFKFK